MPELPEVEHFRTFFRLYATGRIVRAVTADPTILRNSTVRSVGAALRGRRFDEPDRHGKWLVCWTEGPALLLHFGMTGDLIWSGDEPGRHRHDRLVLAFAGGGELRYRNMRKLGGVWLAHDRQEVTDLLGGLGPDALHVSRGELLERLSRRRGMIKAALMDQRLVAGVGNLLADEVLWQARLHPKRSIESMDAAARSALASALARVLRRSVDDDDYIPRRRSWLSHVRGRPGATCPRCGTALERTVAAGRTTYLCPSCQR